MPQPLISRVNVFAKTDGVHVGVEPAGRGHDDVSGGDVVRLNEPGVSVAAEDLEATYLLAL